jgi:opacity protein-like surface antigen
MEDGSWMLEDGCWMLGAGSWELEDGSWKMGVGRWELDDGSWKILKTINKHKLNKKMKKIILIAVLVISSITLAQDKTFGPKKFFLGVNYGLNLNSGFPISDDYNGNIAVDLHYSVFKRDIINVHAGMNLTYLSNNEFFFKKNLLTYNPNIGVEVDAFKSRLRPYVNFGYLFFSDEVENNTLFTSIDPRSQGISLVNYKGFTLNPGFRYYATELLSFEASYKYLQVNTNSNLAKGNNVNTFNIGVGINF